ncbi:MAG: hypothetical protein JSV84_14085 [Gemmatimonadota bacterium]|nr:MAG: hypothetical protein JSV84_14085 [Gemmatimonadota bacterium]
MTKKIRIGVGSITAEAELHDTSTVILLWEALPVEGFANRWGDEVYFKIPVDAELEKEAREVVHEGEVGYWPMGQAFCIFFGPTPASRGDEIRAYSPVNILGRIVGDATVFKDVTEGEPITIDKVA